jgi:hypothetical protein
MPSQENRGGGARRPAGGPSKPPVGVEKVRCACGHEAELPLFDDRRDRLYRDVRRKKLAGGPCPDCRRQAHAELTARQQAEAAQRKAARPEPPAPKQKAPQPPAGRLPDGSEFRVTYHAAAERWAGTLTVTTPEGGQVFEGEAGAVFKLLSALDRQYRVWLAAQAAPPAGGAAEGNGGAAG